MTSSKEKQSKKEEFVQGVGGLVQKPSFKKSEKFFNREISWLEFNQRVLDQSTSDKTPLLERLRFCDIFISNLDQSTLDEAIRSRSFVSDISMTTEQMFMRIEGLMEKMEDKIPTKAKQQAMTIMKELHEKYDGISVNLRSFIKAARICAMGFENAKDMVAEQIIEV